jgi:two-component system response regulator YesN
VHLSESYFTALFKKSTGITVQEYILTCKLEKAKELLMEGKLAISEISDKLEYKDYRSFSRVFKRFSGCSPTEYQHKMTRRQKGN